MAGLKAKLDEMDGEVTDAIAAGSAQGGSPAGDRRIADLHAAEEALQRADAQELFVLYQRAIKDRARFEATLSTVVEHFAGSNDTPRIEPGPASAIEAMERVALAAIELARFHVERSRTAGED